MTLYVFLAYAVGKKDFRHSKNLVSMSSVLIEEPLQRHEMRTYAIFDHPKGGHAIEVHAGEVTAQSFILAVEEHGRPP